MTAQTVDHKEVAEVLAAVLRSKHPRLALPTIAANHDLTLVDLQHLLQRHGYPDKKRMRAEWTNLVKSQDDTDAAEEQPATQETPREPKKDPYVTALPVAALFADTTYQRDLDELRVQRMVTAFDPALVGILEVSHRPGDEDRYAILDGQHRWAAARDHLFDTNESPHMVCRVHTGLTVPEEAQLYHQLNTTRKQLTGWDRWVARRSAGEQAVLDIEACVVDNGYRVGMTTGEGVLRATRACEHVVTIGGIALLDQVLTVVRAAYGDEQAGLDAAILHGLGHVLHSYDREELDLARLIDALQGIVPRQLTARASAVRELHRGTLDRLTGHIIVERYNSTRGRRIEPFFDRIKPLSKAKGASVRKNEAIREWARREGYLEDGKRNLTKRIRIAYAAAHPDQSEEA